jgi:hypothetical protein
MSESLGDAGSTDPAGPLPPAPRRDGETCGNLLMQCEGGPGIGRRDGARLKRWTFTPTFRDTGSEMYIRFGMAGCGGGTGYRGCRVPAEVLPSGPGRPRPLRLLSHEFLFFACLPSLLPFHCSFFFLGKPENRRCGGRTGRPTARSRGSSPARWGGVCVAVLYIQGVACLVLASGRRGWREPVSPATAAVVVRPRLDRCA